MLIDVSGQRLSFKDFKRHIERTVASLSAQGVGLGTRTAWQRPTRPICLALGHVVSPVDKRQHPLPAKQSLCLADRSL